jgi:hypothetical protein
VTIYIQPYIKSELPYESALDKLTSTLYSKLFYKNTMIKYIERQTIYLRQFEELIKKELGLR